MTGIGVVIQERRTLLRDGIALLLHDADDVDVIGTVATGPELIDLLTNEPADVALLELRVDGWDVESIVTAAAGLRPDICLAALHAGRRSDHLRLARRLGMDALVSYNGGVNALLGAVRGEPGVATSPGAERRTGSTVGMLSGREQEVLAHVAAGLTTAESAELLGVSPKTVESHKARLFSKLGVKNQAHAVAQAHRRGILGGATT